MMIVAVNISIYTVLNKASYLAWVIPIFYIIYLGENACAYKNTPRFARDAWSMVLRLSQATNEYPPPRRNPVLGFHLLFQHTFLDAAAAARQPHTTC